MMRTLTYYIATSLDGFISRPDGSLDDFTFEGEHVQDLLDEYPETMPTHLRSHFKLTGNNSKFDTVLMGRGTYEVGSSAGITSPYEHLDQYLFSTSMDASPSNQVTLVREDAVQRVQELKRTDGLGIWLCGGPSLATAIIDEIDEVILKINPFVMGAGKSLFASSMPSRPLQLVNHRHYANGFVLAHYRF